MIQSTCSTRPVQPKEFIFCMGTAMKTCSQIKSQSLLPAESLALTASMGNLLTALGSLLQEHPDLRAGLSPETGQTLITIGEKLNKLSNQIAA